MLFGYVAGFVWGFVAAAAGLIGDAIVIGGGISGLLVGLAWGVIVVRMALRKNYRQFRLALISGSLNGFTT